MKFLRPTHHETFNVLKTNGYNLEHNFGHGKQTLAAILVVLNLLAFAFHTAARLAVLAVSVGCWPPTAVPASVGISRCHSEARQVSINE